jgi:hypothetical protein
MRFLFLIGTTLFLSSCATFSSPFTTEKVMQVHQGMSSSEILKMFGTPKNISQANCGSSTKRPWTCTTWEYGEYQNDRASFTFSGDNPSSLILNDFKIDRD